MSLCWCGCGWICGGDGVVVVGSDVVVLVGDDVVVFIGCGGSGGGRQWETGHPNN